MNKKKIVIITLVIINILLVSIYTFNDFKNCEDTFYQISYDKMHGITVLRESTPDGINLVNVVLNNKIDTKNKYCDFGIDNKGYHILGEYVNGKCLYTKEVCNRLYNDPIEVYVESTFRNSCSKYIY